MFPVAQLDAIIDRALFEDLPGGDVTSLVTVGAETRARAAAVARRGLVVCGFDVFARVFERVDRSSHATSRSKEGARVERGHVL